MVVARTEEDSIGLVRLSGLTPYGHANTLMHDLARRRLAGEISDTLLLVEHPPVYTAGKLWRAEHLVATVEAMEAAGAEFHMVDRGGSVTFHGPGQLVGYPILDLGPRPDVARYVNDLERVIIEASAAACVHGLGRNPANSGVWHGDRKVCAIGIRVMRMRVALHGFALNCSTDLSWFEAILPCGLEAQGVTSLSRLAGREVSVQEMIPHVTGAFESVFGRPVGPARAGEQVV